MTYEASLIRIARWILVGTLTAASGCAESSESDTSGNGTLSDPAYAALFDLAPASSVDPEKVKGVWSGGSTGQPGGYPIRIEIAEDRILLAMNCGGDEFVGVSTAIRIGSSEVKQDRSSNGERVELLVTEIEVFDSPRSETLPADYDKRMSVCMASLKDGRSLFLYNRATKTAEFSALDSNWELIKLKD